MLEKTAQTRAAPGLPRGITLAAALDEWAGDDARRQDVAATVAAFLAGEGAAWQADLYGRTAHPPSPGSAMR